MKEKDLELILENIIKYKELLEKTDLKLLYLKKEIQVNFKFFRNIVLKYKLFYNVKKQEKKQNYIYKLIFNGIEIIAEKDDKIKII